jgi:D-alanyl-lipoteichoic acid acyltransferase DltB (MBOAT superfamily)
VLFNSLSFLVFFGLVFAAYLLLRPWPARKALLLVASYVFYAAWNPPYLLILMFSTALDWWLARRIWRESRPGPRRILLVISLVANLSLLGFFKYGDFALHNAQALFALAGVLYNPPRWDIILPVGISFYTFASLSYTIDVYRREIEADAPLPDYALFVAFFPHLVAGPIVRARALLPQLAQPVQPTLSQIGWGLTLVMVGLACKSALADTLLAPVVDELFRSPSTQSGLGALAGIFGFAGQIYFDFGGYSLCAIGLALCFGFAFPDNFRFPYAARGFSDFWRRWHISLSTWLRDYLYIPLGGNRGGEWATCRNLALTMLLGGLWHGASWMFIAWGALHGVYLIAERLVRRRWNAVLSHRIGDAVLTVVTFLGVCLAWIPFRAPDARTGVAVLAAVGNTWSGTTSAAWTALAVMTISVAWQWRMRDTTWEARAAQSSEGVRAAAVAISMVAIFLTSGGDDRAFIYFQF